MTENRPLKPFMARAFRVLLVFALVFGTSLHVEYTLAYGAGSPDVTVDELADHDDQELTALVIYRSVDDDSGWVPLDEDTPFSLETGAAACYFAAVPVWDGVYPEGYKDGEKLAKVPSAKFAAWDFPGSAVTASIHKETNVAEVQAAAAGTTAATCKAEGKKAEFTITVTESEPVDPDPGTDPDNPDPDNPDPDNPDPDNPDPVVPKPDDPDQYEPEVISVVIRDAQGAEFTDQPQLSFTASQVGQTEQLSATVVIKNLNAKDGSGDGSGTGAGSGGDAGAGDGSGAATAAEGESGSDSGSSAESDTVTYDSLQDGSLESFTDGKLSLAWTTSDAEVLAVDESGLVTVVGEGHCDVKCTATVLSTSQSMPYAIEAVVGSAEKPEEDPQGDAHPQDTLQVIASIGGKVEGGAGEGSNPSGGNAGQDGAEGGAAEGDGSQDGGEGAAGGDSSSAASPNPDQDGGAEGSEGDGGGQQAAVDRTYTLDDIRKLDASGGLTMATETYTMRARGDAVTITGEGFPLMQLLKDAFQGQETSLEDSPVESVDFIDYRGIPVTVDWPTIQNASAMVAMKSRVHVDEQSGGAAGSNSDGTQVGDGDSSGAAAPGDSSGAAQSGDDEDLLDNTRFRILFNTGSDSIDADGLRYIKTIRLNMKAEDSNDFDAYVSYNPVPVGVEAVFVAVPVNSISGSWDCQWEQSTDEGRTWQQLSGETGQSLTLLTTEERLGNLYRVVIENSAIVDGQEKTLKATSEPVEMKAGAGLVISYTPPRPGGLAVFRSSVFGYSGDVSALKYIWEYSENGGISWNVIEEQTKPTLELQTKGDDEDGGSSGSGSGSGDSSASANLIYVRLRAVPPSGNVLVSNIQPLTVQVGDGDGGLPDPGDSDDGRDDAKPGPTGGNPTAPSAPTTGSSTPSGGKPKSPVIPLDIPMTENPPDQESDPGDTVTQALDPNGTAVPTAPREITLGDEAIEQLNQAQEQMQATTPGARWTALKNLNPSSEDIQSILGSNPLAPYVMPFSLSLLVAGGLEKLIAFRRQL